jgi:plastocyanin
MRKGMWSAAALVGLLSGVAVLLIGPGVRAADTKVGMTDQLTFVPDKITVAPGTTVVWHNDGNIQHDVKAKDGSFDSKGLIDPGKEFKFTFNTPGKKFEYYCSPHQGAGMIGTVTVSDGSTTPTAPTATTTETTATTATTAPGQAATTTTTAKAAGASSTTSTTAAGGATTTTLAPAATPTSAPEAATTTTAAPAGGEDAAADHNGEGTEHTKKKHKNSPIGIAFASVSTLLLVAIAGKLLASKP